MPPRIPISSCQSQLLRNRLDHAPSFSLSASPALASPLQSLAAPTPRCSRSFSTTPARPATRLRRRFLEWLDNKGSKYRTPRGPRGTNYVTRPVKTGDIYDDKMPFPNNTLFRSEPVLSDRARELIWTSVMKEGMPLKAVSAQFHVDMRRVAAVVRMKEIEKKWTREVSQPAGPISPFPHTNRLQ